MTRHGGATLCDAMVRRCDTSVSFHCRATTCSVFSVISLLVRRYPSVWCNMPRKSARSSTAADSMASGTANVQDAVRTTATRAKRARRPAVAADASDGKGLMSDQVSDQVSGSVAAVSVASSVPVSAAVTPAVSGVNAASSLLLSAPPIPASLSASRLLCVQVDGKEVFVDTATGATYVPSGSVAANAVGSAPSVFARGAVTQGGLPPAEPAVFQGTADIFKRMAAGNAAVAERPVPADERKRLRESDMQSLPQLLMPILTRLHSALVGNKISFTDCAESVANLRQILYVAEFEGQAVANHYCRMIADRYSGAGLAADVSLDPTILAAARHQSSSGSAGGFGKQRARRELFHCDAHGANPSHSTEKCFILHPELQRSYKSASSAKPKSSASAGANA
eukprot:TRINITY_DN7463_c0_g3_i1.p1 TRINITY_DN7463_c0_g3~~TRINITY_DN7463_c0_g3_i1.p1  ORF type:complete len:396 (-),score=80.85 TRINITY_DN7463_c0_g3_i1:2969-4156(-)